MSQYKISSEFTRKLTTTKLACGKTLRELTQYDDIMFWWFARFDFIDMFLTMPEAETDCRPRGLNFQVWISKLPPWVFMLFNLCLDMARKIFIKILLTVFRRTANGTKAKHATHKILFTSQDIMWRAVKDYKTDEFIKTDAFFDSILKILRRQGSVELIATYPLIKYIYPFRAAVSSLRIFIDKLKNWDITHIPLNLFWSRQVAKSEYKAARHFRDIWVDLKHDKIFRQLCNFQNRDVYDLVERKMQLYFLILFPYAIKRLSLAEKMLEQLRPDLILLINEYGIFERTLLIAGKRCGIATMALQHGYFNPSHQGYMYERGEISEEGQVNSPFCPIPDKTAVFGPYFKELLTQSSDYPDKNIAVTGPPRYDMLNILSRYYRREDILADYGIEPDRKMILWTTQCIGLSDEENINNFRAVRQTAEKLQKCVIVIKQHPREGKYYDRMIRRYLDLPRPEIVLVPKTADTLKLICACDVMITKFSTTALEALALNKTLIIMNLGQDCDKVEYVRQKVALGVYREEELFGVLKKLINDDSDIAEYRKQYIEHYLYKIDGKASQRVANLIIDILHPADAT